MIFTESLFRLTQAAPKLNIQMSMQSLDYADIEVVRNYLATNFYFRSKASHMLFLDTDMGFSVELIRKMLALDKPVVGTVYPRRQPNLQKLYHSKADTFEAAYAEAAGFVGAPPKSAQSDGDFVKVSQVGTGVLMISRACLTTMMEKCPDIVHETRFKSHPAFGNKFDTVITPFDKLRFDDFELSEDLSFCRRWVKTCGGEIHACVSEPVKHQGQIVVESRYRDLDPA